MRLIATGFPLPLASIRNQRSLIGLDNLVSALVAAAVHPRAAGQTFLLSDQTDLSTPDLLPMHGHGLGRPARLLPFPPTLLKVAGAITGRSAEIERLTGSLRVDSAGIRQVLGWRATKDTAAGLAQMTHAFAERQTRMPAPGVRLR